VKKFTEAEKELIWDKHQAGVPVQRIAREMGRLNCSLGKLISNSGGIRPRPRVRAELHLSFDEREERSPRDLGLGSRSGRSPRF
jgi:transposase, IS30 family